MEKWQSQVVMVPKAISVELEDHYACITEELADLRGLPRIWQGLSHRLGLAATEPARA